MADFNYTVKGNDKGLTYIFLREAKTQGYSTDSINWDGVMSVFDKIQAEKRAQNESLFTGGNDKTRAGWQNSYVIQEGQQINLTESQLKEIFNAMDAKKAEDKAGVADTAQVTDNDPNHICKSEDTILNSEKAEGTYNICSTPEGKGYTVLADVSLKGEGETDKFFKKVDVTGPDVHLANTKSQAESGRLSVNTAIYRDLDSKQKAGEVLTEPQQAFMEGHQKDLYSKNIQFDKDDKLVEGTATNGLVESKYTTVVPFPKADTTGPEVRDACKDEDKTINSGNVSGTYNICDGAKDGENHRLLSELKVDGEGEAAKFYKDMKYDEKTGLYTTRNVQGTDANVVHVQAQAQANGISAKTAIYRDLSAKKPEAGQLRDPKETAFMVDYLLQLQDAGLALDKNNQIVELPQPKAEKKGFWSALFASK